MHPIKVTFKTKAGYSITTGPLRNIEVAVTIHSSNVWIELPDGFGFSMTADQAEIILNGITSYSEYPFCIEIYQLFEGCYGFSIYIELEELPRNELVNSISEGYGDILSSNIALQMGYGAMCVLRKQATEYTDQPTYYEKLNNYKDNIKQRYAYLKNK